MNEGMNEFCKRRYGSKFLVDITTRIPFTPLEKLI